MQLTVLFVGAEQDSGQRLRHMLEDSGYAMITAGDPGRALQCFTAALPDIVIIDAEAAGQQGVTLLAQMRALAHDRYVPIVLLVEGMASTHVSGYIQAGADDVLERGCDDTLLRVRLLPLARQRHFHARQLQQYRGLEAFRSKVQRDLYLAQHVFSEITGDSSCNPSFVNSWLKRSRNINGDMFLCRHTPSRDVHLMLVDFSSEGLAAALAAVPVVETFHAMTDKGFSMDEILRSLNSKLYRLLPADVFCSACAIAIHAERSVMHTWNGGMPDAIVMQQDTICDRLPSDRLALGVIADEDFDSTMYLVPITNDSRVYLASNGLFRHSDCEQREVVRQFERQLMASAAEERFATIVAQIESGLCRHGQCDDVAFVEIIADRARDELIEQARPPSRGRDYRGSWKLTFDLDIELLREVNPVPLLISMIADMRIPDDHREGIFTVLSELFSNALEHGLLELSSEMKASAEGFMKYYELREQRLATLEQGWIQIVMEHAPDEYGGAVRIRVADSGCGFDTEAVFIALEDNRGFSGRGIPLVRSLCAVCDYNDAGNAVEVTYHWAAA